MDEISKRFGKTIDKLILDVVKSTITSMDTLGYDLENNEKHKISLRTGYIKKHLDSLNNTAIEVAKDLGLDYTSFDTSKVLGQITEIYTKEKDRNGLISRKLQSGEYDFDLDSIRD
jgi:hypothetical protein